MKERNIIDHLISYVKDNELKVGILFNYISKETKEDGFGSYEIVRKLPITLLANSIEKDNGNLKVSIDIYKLRINIDMECCTFIRMPYFILPIKGKILDHHFDIDKTLFYLSIEDLYFNILKEIPFSKLRVLSDKDEKGAIYYKEKIITFKIVDINQEGGIGFITGSSTVKNVPLNERVFISYTLREKIICQEEK